jgi:hypothetical protein
MMAKAGRRGRARTQREDDVPLEVLEAQEQRERTPVRGADGWLRYQRLPEYLYGYEPSVGDWLLIQTETGHALPMQVPAAYVDTLKGALIAGLQSRWADVEALGAAVDAAKLERVLAALEQGAREQGDQAAVERIAQLRAAAPGVLGTAPPARP